MPYEGERNQFTNKKFTSHNTQITKLNYEALFRNYPSTWLRKWPVASADLLLGEIDFLAFVLVSRKREREREGERVGERRPGKLHVPSI